MGRPPGVLPSLQVGSHRPHPACAQACPSPCATDGPAHEPLCLQNSGNVQLSVGCSLDPRGLASEGAPARSVPGGVAQTSSRAHTQNGVCAKDTVTVRAEIPLREILCRGSPFPLWEQNRCAPGALASGFSDADWGRGRPPPRLRFWVLVALPRGAFPRVARGRGVCDGRPPGPRLELVFLRPETTCCV